MSEAQRGRPLAVLFLVTARGGSKGIPRKNLVEIAGMPLVAYKIVAAKRTRGSPAVVCSTDSREIAAVARTYGADVPFLRPAELAEDHSSSVDVVIHALDWLERERDERYDAVMLLEPSSPFTRPTDLEQAIALYRERDALSVVGIREARPHPVFIAEIQDDRRMLRHYEQMMAIAASRRQDLPRVYTMNGALYLVSVSHLRERRTIYTDRTYGHVMPAEHSIEIDEPDDLICARALAESGRIDLSAWMPITPSR